MLRKFKSHLNYCPQRTKFKTLVTLAHQPMTFIIEGMSLQAVLNSCCSLIGTVSLMIVHIVPGWKHLQAQPTHVASTLWALHVITSLILLNRCLAFRTFLSIAWVLHHPLHETSLYLLLWFEHSTSEPIVPLHVTRCAGLSQTCITGEGSPISWDAVYHATVRRWTVLHNFRISFDILI